MFFDEIQIYVLLVIYFMLHDRMILRNKHPLCKVIKTINWIFLTIFVILLWASFLLKSVTILF